MQAKLIVSFERLNEAEYLAKSSAILAALTGNPHYQEPWATQAPTLQQLQAAFNDHQAAYFDSLSKDTQKIALRDATRVTLTALLKQLAPYLELVAQGDTAILATTGYGLRNDIVHNQGSKNWGQSYLMLQLLFLMGGCLTLAYISWPKKSVKGTHRSLAVLNIKFKFKVIDFAKVHQAARPLP